MPSDQRFGRGGQVCSIIDIVRLLLATFFDRGSFRLVSFDRSAIRVGGGFIDRLIPQAMMQIRVGSLSLILLSGSGRRRS